MTNTSQPTPSPYFATAPSASSAAQSRGLSIVSLVLGLVSIVAGWTFFAPIAGLVVGILALRREPASRTMAIWGIVLNGIMLFGAIVVVLVMLAGFGAGLAFLPFAFAN